MNGHIQPHSCVEKLPARFICKKGIRVAEKGTGAGVGETSLPAPPECPLCATSDQLDRYIEDGWQLQGYNSKDIRKELIRIRISNPDNAGSCYLLKVTRSLSWAQAYHYCRARNANLIYIDYLEDPQIIYTALHFEQVKVATADVLMASIHLLNGHSYLYSTEESPGRLRWLNGSLVETLFPEGNFSVNGSFCLGARVTFNVENDYSHLDYSPVPCSCSPDALLMGTPFIFTCQVNLWDECGIQVSKQHFDEFVQ